MRQDDTGGGRDGEAALRAYLQVHLAGASTVSGLVERRVERGDGPDWLPRFSAELAQEAAVVRRVADRLDAAVGLPDRLVGAFTHLAADAALRATTALHDALDDLLELEAMSTGVAGKLCLWRTLEQWHDHPAVADVDLAELVAQGEAQRERLESARRDAARRLRVR